MPRLSRSKSKTSHRPRSKSGGSSRSYSRSKSRSSSRSSSYHSRGGSSTYKRKSHSRSKSHSNSGYGETYRADKNILTKRAYAALKKAAEEKPAGIAHILISGIPYRLTPKDRAMIKDAHENKSLKHVAKVLAAKVGEGNSHAHKVAKAEIKKAKEKYGGRIPIISDILGLFGINV